ncbi:MAG: hypothetical protein IKP46_01920 [Bacteroidales bacterium]|nr:hypothetical protein [Bacteroidales bacterium]
MTRIKLIWIALCVALAAACNDDAEFRRSASHDSRDVPQTRSDDPETRRVLLLYSAGFNSLSSYLKEDIEDELMSGYIPGDSRMENVLLVFSKLTTAPRKYEIQTAPVLFRLYKDIKGNVVSDTLRTWPVGTRAVDTEVVREVLTYVREEFPAAGYGMIFSSHSTGWVPDGYYSDPSYFEGDDDTFWGAPRKLFRYREINDGSGPDVKSVGQEYANGTSESYEIDLEDFAAAIPYKLDYLIFDSCLMGGVEVAWALRDKTFLVAFSQTEILAQGMPYKTLGKSLVGPAGPDVAQVCKDYFEQYDSGSTGSRSATISLIDTSSMDELAEICAVLFDRYGSAIAALNSRTVQCFGRNDHGVAHYWYFDLRDILVKAGANESDLTEFDAVLEKVVLYSAHTPSFLGIVINTNCGLSMYLPVAGSEYLDNFYRSSISWNEAVSLVR